MLPTEPKVGWLFRYLYLWHWQFLEGREEGDKDRPALVLAIVARLDDGTPAVRVLPITHTHHPTLRTQSKSRRQPNSAWASMTTAPGLS
jgi:hypothetical protein